MYHMYPEAFGRFGRKERLTPVHDLKPVLKTLISLGLTQGITGKGNHRTLLRFLPGKVHGCSVVRGVVEKLQYNTRLLKSPCGPKNNMSGDL